MEHWVYIVRCLDRSYYTGITVSVNKRIDEHNAGIVPGYTHHRRPVTLVWAECLEDEHTALRLERQIKGWTRVKKEALIARDWDRLHGIVAEGKQSRSR
ncbi:MAG: GIY-YIG nuclease family protein [Anaerolineales bacterium]|nr:GIY-YIG nuclease family protein [Anaerolineales bacterium]